jgi:hypothetical protein
VRTVAPYLKKKRARHECLVCKGTAGYLGTEDGKKPVNLCCWCAPKWERGEM